MVRFAKRRFHVRQDLLTGFLARVPFESFSGLFKEGSTRSSQTVFC
jgi:hypothetical protein